jgi:hypothetical protein
MGVVNDNNYYRIKKKGVFNMPLTHTKQQVKEVGTDIKNVGKGLGKLGVDIFKILPSIFTDVRQHFSDMKDFGEQQKSQATADEPITEA